MCLVAAGIYFGRRRSVSDITYNYFLRNEGLVYFRCFLFCRKVTLVFSFACDIFSRVGNLTSRFYLSRKKSSEICLLLILNSCSWWSWGQISSNRCVARDARDQLLAVDMVLPWQFWSLLLSLEFAYRAFGYFGLDNFAGEGVGLSCSVQWVTDLRCVMSFLLRMNTCDDYWLPILTATKDSLLLFSCQIYFAFVLNMAFLRMEADVYFLSVPCCTWCSLWYNCSIFHALLCLQNADVIQTLYGNFRQRPLMDLVILTILFFHFSISDF